MKIAVCFSGQIRTGLDTASNILRYIGDLLPECDFFVHTWDIESASRNTHPNAEPKPIDQLKIEQFFKVYKPKAIIVDKYDIWRTIPRICGIRHDPVLDLWYNSMWESIYEVNLLKKRWEERYHMTYDYVVRIRPDLLFNKDKTLRHDLTLVIDTNMFVQGEHMSIDHKDRVEDIFWMSRSKTMDRLVEFRHARAHSGWDNEEFDKIPGFISMDYHLANWCKAQNLSWRPLDDNRISVHHSVGPSDIVLETDGDSRRKGQR